jgi:hypothetical protein
VPAWHVEVSKRKRKAQMWTNRPRTAEQNPRYVGEDVRGRLRQASEPPAELVAVRSPPSTPVRLIMHLRGADL